MILMTVYEANIQMFIYVWDIESSDDLRDTLLNQSPEKDLLPNSPQSVSPTVTIEMHQWAQSEKEAEGKGT